MHPGTGGDDDSVESLTLAVRHHFDAACTLVVDGGNQDAAPDLPAERLDAPDHGGHRRLGPDEPSLRVEDRDVSVSHFVTGVGPVSYTHLTLPTNREVQI